MIQKIKQIYLMAKASLNKARYIYNFYYLPVLLVFSILDLLTILIMMLVNSKGLLIPSLVLFLILVAAFIGSLIALPFVRKSEIKEEGKRIEDFFESSLLTDPQCDYVLSRANVGGIVPLVFAKTGLSIDGISYTYDAFTCALFTSNYKYRVNLIIVFNRNEEGDKQDGEEEGVQSFSLPLDINLLSIMDKFDIKLANSDVLAFIKDNPTLAAKQILKYGKIQKDYDKYKTK